MADTEVARLQQELNDYSSKCANLQQKLEATQCRAQSRYRETLLANRRAEQLQGTISDKNFILKHEMTKRLSLERSLGAANEQLRQLRKEKDEAVELQIQSSDILGEGCTKHELEKQIQKMKAQTEHEMRMYKLVVDRETKKSRASWQDETGKEHEHIITANQQLQKLCQDGQEEIEKLKRSLKTLEKELTWHKNRLRERAREESVRVITHPLGSPSSMRDQKRRKLNEHNLPSSPHHFSPREQLTVSPARNQRISSFDRSPPPAPNFLGGGSSSRAASSTYLAQAFATTGNGAGFNPSQLQDLISTQSTRADTSNNFQNSPTQNDVDDQRPPSRPGSAMALTVLKSPLIEGVGIPVPQTRPQMVNAPLSMMSAQILRDFSIMSGTAAQLEELKQKQRYFSPGQKVRYESMTDTEKQRTLFEFRAHQSTPKRETQQPDLGQAAPKPAQYSQSGQIAQQSAAQYNIYGQNCQRPQQTSQQQHDGSNAQTLFGVSPLSHTFLHSRQLESQQFQQRLNSHEIPQQLQYVNDVQLQNRSPQQQTPVDQMRPTISAPSIQGSNSFNPRIQLDAHGTINAHPTTIPKVILKLKHTDISPPTTSPPQVATSPHTAFSSAASAAIFVPRRVACLRCYENWWEKSCDSGEPCANCKVDTILKKECVRPKCENFIAGTCLRGIRCKRAHEDDRYDYVEKYQKHLKRIGLKRDSAIAPSLSL